MGRLLRVVLTVAVVAGCATDREAQTPTTSVPERTTTTSTTTTMSTSTTTTSTSTTTTTLPPTTLPRLPVPAPPPPEDGSSDPRIELGSIEIPRLGLARAMFEGIRLSTLDQGPGHWPGTAMPGDIGNAVVAGHRVSHNRDFRDLDQLQPGDEVIMSTMSGRHVYRVLSTEIVTPDAMWVVEQTPAQRATLFACHPPGSVRERIVVHLELAA